MQKLLLTVLLAGLTSVASAQVVLSGKIGTTIDRTDVGSTVTKGFVNDPTSNIAISASEKVGNLGFRAVLETSLFDNTFGTTGTQLGDRQSTVGFTYKGSGVDFGRNVHSHFLNVTLHDPFKTVYGSIAGDIHPLHGLRMSNGMFAQMQVAKNAQVAAERTYGELVETTVLAASGTFGPVSAMVSRYEKGTDKSVIVSASAKLVGNTLTVTHSDNEGTAAHKGTTVNAMRDIGPWTMKASYGQTNTDIKAYAVGADYNFSKRTTVGVAYRNVDHLVINDVKQIGLGITHRF